MDGRRFLGQVKSVIIDEVHSFAGDDRGCHLLALLARLMRISGHEFQRIALSATVGNPEFLSEWLTCGCSGKKTILLPPEGPTPKSEVTLDYVGSLENAAHVLGRMFRGEKRLVFIDSRARAEKLGNELRKLGSRTFVTHSSLSHSQRSDAEEAFQSAADCIIVATSVLELGVDVGDLDRVIQIDAPYTVSAFLQRMGRTGRRPGSVRNCLFLGTGKPALLRAAGLIELFKKGYVEPVNPPKNTFNILAQQLMALILQEKGIGRHDWFKWVQAVPTFAGMNRREIDSMVSWMLANDVIAEDQDILFISKKGEDDYGRRNFLELLSVFLSAPIFVVVHGREELGYIDEQFFLDKQSENKHLLLAGRSWRICQVEWKARRVYVEPSESDGGAWWAGESVGTSFMLSQAIKSVLASPNACDLWSHRATNCIEAMRLHMPWLTEIQSTHLVKQEGSCCWWTFGGTSGNSLLSNRLEEECHVENITRDHLAIRFPAEISQSRAAHLIASLRETPNKAISLQVNEKALTGLKFSDIIPQVLVVESLRHRIEDANAVASVLKSDLESVY